MVTSHFTETSHPLSPSSEDPRVIELIKNNLSNETWNGHRPGDPGRDEGEIPRAWRAKGYESVASLINAWIGGTRATASRPWSIDARIVRGWWRTDLANRRSESLPPPDAIIKRAGDTLLPGWADETIREWLSSDHLVNGKVAEMDHATYLAWDEITDEIDPYVVAYIDGNAEHGIQPNRAGAVRMKHGGETFTLPPAYLALGYQFTAQVMSDLTGHSVSDNTVCKYWRDDLLRDYRPEDGTVDSYSRYIAIPDAIIGRGPRGLDLLPGWSRGTIEVWLPTRPGSGNHTRGENRRGYREGRTGMEKIYIDGKPMFVTPRMRASKATKKTRGSKVANAASAVPAS